MNKQDVLNLLNELYDDVQGMREQGETDLRTVLHFIDSTIREIRKLDS